MQEGTAATRQSAGPLPRVETRPAGPHALSRPAGTDSSREISRGFSLAALRFCPKKSAKGGSSIVHHYSPLGATILNLCAAYSQENPRDTCSFPANDPKGYRVIAK